MLKNQKKRKKNGLSLRKILGGVKFQDIVEKLNGNQNTMTNFWANDQARTKTRKEGRNYEERRTGHDNRKERNRKTTKV